MSAATTTTLETPHQRSDQNELLSQPNSAVNPASVKPITSAQTIPDFLFTLNSSDAEEEEAEKEMLRTCVYNLLAISRGESLYSDSTSPLSTPYHHQNQSHHFLQLNGHHRSSLGEYSSSSHPHRNNESAEDHQSSRALSLPNGRRMTRTLASTLGPKSRMIHFAIGPDGGSYLAQHQYSDYPDMLSSSRSSTPPPHLQELHPPQRRVPREAFGFEITADNRYLCLVCGSSASTLHNFKRHQMRFGCAVKYQEMQLTQKDTQQSQEQSQDDGHNDEFSHHNSDLQEDDEMQSHNGSAVYSTRSSATQSETDLTHSVNNTDNNVDNMTIG